MPIILMIMLMSGQPECESWLQRFFSIECANHEVRRHTTDNDKPHSPGRDGDGDGGGNPGTGDGGEPPTGGGTTTPPDGGGTTPPTPETGDANKGHGNDPGRHDPDNPGKGQGKGRNR